MGKKTSMTEQIYEYLQAVIPEQGYAPSVREIGKAVGLKSPSTVHFHLKRLQEQGLIEKGDFKGRAIALTQRTGKDRVPIVGSVAAGTPILAQECIEDYLTFDCGGQESEYFVRQQQTARVGEIVVALFEDEATVKRFSVQDGHVWLLPENDAYEPIDGTNAQILGKVTAVVRQYP